VAIAGDPIVALPGTLTGSMGVLFQLTNFSRLLDKVLVDPVTIRSGDLKDAGNPTRPMDAKSKKLFEELVKQTFESFKKSVTTERKLKPEVVANLSDGRVINGEQALEMGIVDKLGTFQDAIDIAKEKGKISDKPHLVYLSRETKSWFEKLLSSQIQTLREEMARAVQTSASLQYLWKF
jgi:protease-4